MRTVLRIVMAGILGGWCAVTPTVLAEGSPGDVRSGTITVADSGTGLEPNSKAEMQRIVLNDGSPERGAASVPLQVFMMPKLVKAAYVGVFVSPADQTVQAQLKLGAGVGLVVNTVEAKSPAESAGLQTNDVITYFGDQLVINPEQFEVLVRLHKPGEAVQVTVVREAQPLKLTVTLAEKEQPELAWALSSRRAAFGVPGTIGTQLSVPSGATLILNGKPQGQGGK